MTRPISNKMPLQMVGAERHSGAALAQTQEEGCGCDAMERYWRYTYNPETPWYGRMIAGLFQGPMLIATLAGGGCAKEEEIVEAEDGGSEVEPSSVKFTAGLSSTYVTLDGECSWGMESLKRSLIGSAQLYGLCVHLSPNSENGNYVFVSIDTRTDPPEKKSYTLESYIDSIDHSEEINDLVLPLQITESHFVMARNAATDAALPDEIMVLDIATDQTTDIPLSEVLLPDGSVDSDGRPVSSVMPRFITDIALDEKRSRLWVATANFSGSADSESLLFFPGTVIPFRYDASGNLTQESGFIVTSRLRPLRITVGGKDRDKLFVLNSPFDGSSGSLDVYDLNDLERLKSFNVEELYPSKKYDDGKLSFGGDLPLLEVSPNGEQLVFGALYIVRESFLPVWWTYLYRLGTENLEVIPPELSLEWELRTLDIVEIGIRSAQPDDEGRIYATDLKTGATFRVEFDENKKLANIREITVIGHDPQCLSVGQREDGTTAIIVEGALECRDVGASVVTADAYYQSFQNRIMRYP